MEIEYKKLDSSKRQDNNDLISCRGISAELKRNNKNNLEIGRYVLRFRQGKNIKS